MKPLAFLLLCVPLLHAADLTNTVMMVDQHGHLNVEGVASVEDVATNAVKVTIAEEKAAAAQATARGVTNALQAVAENIMENNAVIYRSGFSDSFAPLVAIGPDDKLAIVEARWVEKSASRLRVEIDYVSTADLGAVKPIIKARNTLGPREDFDELPDANVTSPTYHAEERTYNDQPFAGYYTVTATIANPASTTQYFIWIRVEGDNPSGDGTTLELPNGVTGGMTGDYVWGDKVLHFKGGVLKGVTDND